MNNYGYLDDWTAYLLFLLCVPIVCFLLPALLPDRIDSCYVEMGITSNFVLRGHVDWNSDKLIGRFDTIDEAIAAANKLACPLTTP